MRNKIAQYLFKLANWVSPEKKVISKARPRMTHCRKGHPLTLENTYIHKHPDGREGHDCRICISERARLRHQAKEGTTAFSRLPQK